MYISKHMREIDHNGTTLLGIIGESVRAIGLFVCMLSSGLLALSSLFVTYHNDLFDEITETLTLSAGFVQGITTAIGVLLFAALLFLVSTIPVKHGVAHAVLVLVCVLATIGQLWWVFTLDAQSSYFSDSNQLMMYAKDLATGTMSCFNSEQVPFDQMKSGTIYFTNYPYQAGMLFYYYAFFTAFKNVAPTVIQLFNVAANTASIVFLYLIGCCAIKRPGGRVILSIVLGGFIPPFLYSTMFYSNQVGLSLALAYTALNVYALKSASLTKQRILCLVSFLPLSLALTIKSTLVLIALAVIVVYGIYFLSSISFSRFLTLILAVLGFFFANTIASLPLAWLEGTLGYSLGEGIPKTAWIAMGLQNESVLGKEMSGWWNPYPNLLQEATNNDYQLMVNESVSEIGSRIAYFISNPFECLVFFSRKLATEWLTPDFQANYFASINFTLIDGNEVQCFSTNASTIPAIQDYVKQTGEAWELISGLGVYLDCYQSSVYLFAFSGFLDMFRNRKALNCSILVLPCTFFVGIIVYFLWEAKAQYVMPFFMCLIPISVYGLLLIQKRGDCLATRPRHGVYRRFHVPTTRNQLDFDAQSSWSYGAC